MTEQEVEAKLQEMITLLKPIVAKIENSPPATKGHYDQYLAVLAEVPTSVQRSRLAKVLVLAGANRSGVQAALDLM